MNDLGFVGTSRMAPSKSSAMGAILWIVALPQRCSAKVSGFCPLLLDASARAP